MKPSKYNIIFDHDNKKYLFNTISCGMAEVDEKFLNELNSGTNRLKSYPNYEELVTNRFIVEDDFDELAFIKYRLHCGTNMQFVRLTITLTLACNFNCAYCYENPRNGLIKDEVKEAIYKKIEEILKTGKKISVTWFGGEPLIAKEIIWEMSQKIDEICAKYNTTCIYDMSTNGYLLDQNVISQLIEHRVNSFQVTLDGPPEIRDTRRTLKNGKGGTFETIIKNLQLALSKGMSIRIRVNVSRSNAKYLEDLMKVLAENNLQKCFVYVAYVRAYTKQEDGSTLTAEEFSNIVIDFAKLLKKYEFGFYLDSCYPHFLFSNCGAGTESNLVIDPDGYLYRCFAELGHIGSHYGNILKTNLKSDINWHMNNIKYLTCSPFEKQECVNCKVLPLCLGGCKFYTLNTGEPDCSVWKYNINEALKAFCDLIKKDE